MNAFFLFAEVYALTMITYAKWIKYETGNGTPETNGTSEPIRNVRSKNGIRQYTWCIDRLNCFPLKRREQHPSLFSFLENFSVLSIHWRFVPRRVRGYNKTRYRLEQGAKIAVCMVALPKVLWFSTTVALFLQRIQVLHETRDFRTNWNYSVTLRQSLENACVSHREKMRTFLE